MWKRLGGALRMVRMRERRTKVLVLGRHSWIVVPRMMGRILGGAVHSIVLPNAASLSACVCVDERGGGQPCKTKGERAFVPGIVAHRCMQGW
jgi:hypothetical protein